MCYSEEHYHSLGTKETACLQGCGIYRDIIIAWDQRKCSSICRDVLFRGLRKECSLAKSEHLGSGEEESMRKKKRTRKVGELVFDFARQA
jgi:hypothetical protein